MLHITDGERYAASTVIAVSVAPETVNMRKHYTALNRLHHLLLRLLLLLFLPSNVRWNRGGWNGSETNNNVATTGAATIAQVDVGKPSTIKEIVSDEGIDRKAFSNDPPTRLWSNNANSRSFAPSINH